MIARTPHPRPRPRPVGRVFRDTTGITVVEFAVVAPVLLLLILGMGDLGFQVYATANLEGSLQRAAREATLEKGFSIQDQIDQSVKEQVKRVLPAADVSITRRNYKKFADIVTPEIFTDNNGDGICNDGEPFEDINANGVWDMDRGSDGLGGARDAVLFTATASYSRMFPLANFVPGIEREVQLVATTVLRNQPYNEQRERVPEEGNCT